MSELIEIVRFNIGGVEYIIERCAIRPTAAELYLKSWIETLEESDSLRIQVMSIFRTKPKVNDNDYEKMMDQYMKALDALLKRMPGHMDTYEYCINKANLYNIFRLLARVCQLDGKNNVFVKTDSVGLTKEKLLVGKKGLYYLLFQSESEGVLFVKDPDMAIRLSILLSLVKEKK